MIICSCNMLSDRDVRRVVTGAGAQQLTAGQVYDCLHCGARCGRCARTIKRIMQEASARCEAGCACCPRSTPGADTNARPRDVIWDGGSSRSSNPCKVAAVLAKRCNKFLPSL
jgi:bacterioferritin-associated ferredoxin